MSDIEMKKVCEAYDKEVNGYPRIGKHVGPSPRCKSCGSILIVHAVPIDPMARNNCAGQSMTGACSNCGSREYQDISTDQMQGSTHQIVGNGLPDVFAHDVILASQKDHIAELDAMVRKHEWNGNLQIDMCPECGGIKGMGHYTNCRLKSLIDGGK